MVKLWAAVTFALPLLGSVRSATPRVAPREVGILVVLATAVGEDVPVVPALHQEVPVLEPMPLLRVRK